MHLAPEKAWFRKDAGAVAEWSPTHVTACAARQSAILETAAKTVRGGGVLIYSTCTFSAEENENVVERFLAAHPEFSLEHMRRLYPHSSPERGISWRACAGQGMDFVHRRRFR